MSQESQLAGPQPVRLPSFNDFSPGILGGDVRRPLSIVDRHPNDRGAAVAEFAREFFKSKASQRSKANVPATLTSTGLVDRDTFALTEFGRDVLFQPDARAAARAFARGLLLAPSGMLLIEAIRALWRKREGGSRKALLKRELESLGIEGLARATTDHTTFENWLVEAGLVVEEGGYRRPDDEALRDVVGVGSDEFSDLLALDDAQQLFLRVIRRRTEVEGITCDLRLAEVYDECRRNASALFGKDDQFRSSLVNPLVAGGWIDATPAHTGKGGTARAAPKLMRIPIEKVLPRAFGGVPGDLRRRLDAPLGDVLDLLHDPASKYNRGLGLELLALRMLFDLGLEPRGFRVRARETAYAEVDLLAEGRNLLFSRWVVQCKNLAKGSNVALGDVAKEVGIAIHQKAHVIAIMTTTDFSREARRYADEVTRDTHLQFLLVPGLVVEHYLRAGAGKLVAYVLDNAAGVMSLKRGQVTSPGNEETATEE
jgi:hypothetical protein